MEEIIHKKMRILLSCFTVIVLILMLPIIASSETEKASPFFEENVHYCFKVIKKLAHISTMDKFSVMQGGGTDGEYAYYAMIAQKLYSKNTLVYKYDMKTWQCVLVSEPLSLGHANDITYDPEHNRLLVAYVNTNRISYLDPDTLAFLGYGEISIPISRLEYLPETKQVLVGSGYTLAKFYKDSWKKIEFYFDSQDDRYTTQGLTSDGTYVYDIRWDDTLYEASLIDDSIICDYIVVHDLNGIYWGSFPAYGLEGEPENIIWLGGKYFAIGCNGSDSVFLTELCISDQ